jgi:hypothetical protein
MTPRPASNPDGIPPLLPPDQMPSITDQAALYRTWRALMGPLGFSRRQLWVLAIDGDRPRGVTQVDEVPARLDDDMAVELLSLFAEVAPGASLAFLYARPGLGPRTADDLSWGAALSRATRTVPVRVWPVHLADDRAITVVAPDDLADAV